VGEGRGQTENERDLDAQLLCQVVLGQECHCAERGTANGGGGHGTERGKGAGRGKDLCAVPLQETILCYLVPCQSTQLPGSERHLGAEEW